MTEYRFADGTREAGPIFNHGKIRICTLPWKDALGLRRLGGELYFSRDCDLIRVEGETQAIRPVQPGVYDCRKWDGTKFKDLRLGSAPPKPTLTITDLDSAPFELPEMFAAELRLGGVRPLIWKKLEVKGNNRFIELDFKYDVAQIYADGKLVADQYDCGFPWRIPASLLDGKECYLVMSPRIENIYREEDATPPQQ